MLYEIIAFLLDVIVGLLGGACLLRMYMQYQRIPFGNPVGRFVFALTDWLVLPLRRVVPAAGRWDLASAVAAYVLLLAQFGLLWLMAARATAAAMVPLLAAFGLVRLVISALTGLMVIYVIMSWVRSDTPIADVIDRLCAPLLRPLRRVIPLAGGIDLTPLVFLVLLQVGAIVLASVQRAMLT